MLTWKSNCLLRQACIEFIINSHWRIKCLEFFFFFFLTFGQCISKNHKDSFLVKKTIINRQRTFFSLVLAFVSLKSKWNQRSLIWYSSHIMRVYQLSLSSFLVNYWDKRSFFFIYLSIITCIWSSLMLKSNQKYIDIMCDWSYWNLDADRSVIIYKSLYSIDGFRW